jgi:glycosyltransferase involved in cell wall biosynthesis
VNIVSLSFVVPVYSGASYLPELVKQIHEAVAGMVARGVQVELREICLVDDAAIDNSSDLVDELALTHPKVRAIHLSRNFGQHPATIAGISVTTGDWVVTLDEDLQHRPAAVEQLLRHAISTGSDLVYATAEGAVHHSALRDWGSRGYKYFMQWISGNPAIRIFNSFRLIRGDIARAAARSCGHDTYFDIALSWFTQRVSGYTMPMRDDRYIATGKSGYRFSKLVSHARRMMMSSGAKSLRLSGLLGLAISVCSILAGLALTLVQLAHPGFVEVRGWVSTVVIVTFLSGVIMLMLGVVLEYLSMLVLSAHGKPLFFVIDRSKDAALLESFERPPVSKREI